MVPTTALVFVLIGVSVAADTVTMPRGIDHQLQATLGLLIALSGSVVLFGHVLNVALVAGQPVPALSTGIAFVLLGIGRVLGVGAQSWQMLAARPSTSRQVQRNRRWAWLGSVILVVGFATAFGVMAMTANQDHEREAAFRLAGITAESEAQKISAWFKERQADADVLRTSPLIGDELLHVVGPGASATQRLDVQHWLDALQTHYEYDRLTLTDAGGRVLLEAHDADPLPLDSRALAVVGAAVSTGAVQFVDKAWSEETTTPVSWVVPLGGTPAVAALVLSTELRPTLLTESMSTGVRPAAAGQESDLPVTDDRGVPVFAAVRQIAGTPWALIARVDRAKVYAAANETTLIMGAALSGAAFTVMLALGLLWYRRELKTTEHIVSLTQEQAKSDDMVRTLFTAASQTPVSIVITNLEGTISYVNPMFTQVTGYTAEEVIGQNPRILKSGEWSGAEYGKLWRTILDGRVWHGELHNRRKNGELFWESATIAPLRDNAGQVNGFVALKREITAEKIANEAHARLQLEFGQAQKMESVGRLASGVAHDFNNMLAVILGHAELALDGLDETSPQREHLVEILQAGQRSSELTKQLLAFARKQKANPKLINLNDEIGNTLKMLKRLIGENIDLVWKPGADLAHVFMDPAQVDQILANLSVNARDAITGAGTVTIETEAVTVSVDQAREHPVLQPGSFVRLAIRDTGCGMTPEVRA
jgi:PAS domain S-box-containing protein